jgi:uncharacterized protein
MDIEKELLVAAPAAHVWALLLDPNVMGACVPGMQSIDVISDVEYVSVIHVKIAFISAKFKIKTIIVEQRAPNYLRTEGTGEDASVASSLKQSSEIFLTERDDGTTELRMKIHVDVLGRLGTFGLSVMKTKADRMWDEFANNLAGRLAPQVAAAPVSAIADQTQVVPQSTPQTATQSATPSASAATAPPAVRVPSAMPPANSRAVPAPSWWSRLFGARQPQSALAAAPAWPHIRVDLKRGDTAITVYWPLEASADCRAWLQDWTK